MKRFGPNLRKKRCVFVCKTDGNLAFNVSFNFGRFHCLILSNLGLFKIDFLLEVKTRDTGSSMLCRLLRCMLDLVFLDSRDSPPVKIQVRHLCSIPSSCWRLFYQHLAHILLVNKVFCLWGLCTYSCRNHLGRVLLVDRQGALHTFFFAFFLKGVVQKGVTHRVNGCVSFSAIYQMSL